jgi:hypothetical protein
MNSSRLTNHSLAKMTFFLWACLSCSLQIGAAWPRFAENMSPAAQTAKKSSSVTVPAPNPAAGAKLTFRRVFKSSTPEFIEITVREDSDDATYDIRQLEEDAAPAPFQVSAALRGKMFDLASQLKHFDGLDLDVHRKIANLGEKTFRWERGGEAHQAKFNYTLNSPATQLLQIFEGLARQQELLALLERRMKYDRLGINDALLQFETDLNRNLLPEPQRALRTLDQIASDSRFVEIGRQRARALADRIRRQS